MRKLVIFVEGGPPGKGSARAREAFDSFLAILRNHLRATGWSMQVVPCGPRSDAVDRFRNRRASKPGADICALLVDAEAACSGTALQHLIDHNVLAGTEAQSDEVYLMVQAMEAWLLGDIDGIKEFMKKSHPRFKPEKLEHPSPETLAKDTLLAMLQASLKETSHGRDAWEGCKGTLAFDWLRNIRAEVVAQKCPSCRRLLDELPTYLAAH